VFDPATFQSFYAAGRTMAVSVGTSYALLSNDVTRCRCRCYRCYRPPSRWKRRRVLRALKPIAVRFAALRKFPGLPKSLVPSYMHMRILRGGRTLGELARGLLLSDSKDTEPR
jgi:hypothetical protein